MLGMAPDYDSLTIVQKVGVTARQLCLRAVCLKACQLHMSWPDAKAGGVPTGQSPQI